MDVATFRADFPQFADVTTYPDASVNFWLGLAVQLLPSDRWGDLLSQGIELYAAHNLTLATRAATVGGGLYSGPASSKSVDKVSVSYDTKFGLEPDAGVWALTPYGNQFLYLMRLIGAGGIQL